MAHRKAFSNNSMSRDYHFLSLGSHNINRTNPRPTASGDPSSLTIRSPTKSRSPALLQVLVLLGIVIVQQTIHTEHGHAKPIGLIEKLLVENTLP